MAPARFTKFSVGLECYALSFFASSDLRQQRRQVYLSVLGAFGRMSGPLESAGFRPCKNGVREH